VPPIPAGWRTNCLPRGGRVVVWRPRGAGRQCGSADVLSALYQAELGRAADAGGLANWTAYLAGGGNLSGVRTAIAGSAEAQGKVTGFSRPITAARRSAPRSAAGQTQLASGLSLTRSRHARVYGSRPARHSSWPRGGPLSATGV